MKVVVVTKLALFVSLLSLSIQNNCAQTKPVDASIVGFLNPAGGIGKIAGIFIEALTPELTTTFIPTFIQNNNLETLPNRVKNIINSSNRSPGNVSVFTGLLWHSGRSPYKAVPENSLIKIAYSMVEFSRIPKEWTSILNNHFDAVAVPDEWLVEVYEKSGVKIPIFVLPLITPLDAFLNQPIRIKPKRPFVFGTVSAVKNTVVTIESFIKAFGKSDDVRLRLHFRQGDFPEKKSLMAYIQQKRREGYTNVEEMHLESLSEQEYIQYRMNFDCDVSLSNGEGFGLGAREASALGKPVIITDQSAFHTICQTGFVRAVPAKIRMPAAPAIFNSQPCGYYLQCTIEDAAEAFTDVFTNYDKYLYKARQAREWVKGYSLSALKQKYKNLVKPSSIIFGKKNLITDEGLITNSKQLYKKYKSLTIADTTTRKKSRIRHN